MQSPANEKHWYAVYVKSRTEKKVLLELVYQNIDAYLPLQKRLRKWSDRKKLVDFPLIPGYIFVYITRKDYDRVLKVPGVVTYVRFEGTAAVIPDEQIEIIKRLLNQHEHKIEVSFKDFKTGDEIEIIAGPLMGVKGVLTQLKGRNKVAVQLEKLQIALTLEVPINEIKKTNI
ncbi:MAG TPA: UpxY family transcription antiterminator [Prolixibacteraceae bacterium]|nr:UpxY family transcription antiterminator [Prolixibacteraceae bacterium]